MKLKTFMKSLFLPVRASEHTENADESRKGFKQEEPEERQSESSGNESVKKAVIILHGTTITP